VCCLRRWGFCLLGARLQQAAAAERRGWGMTPSMPHLHQPPAPQRLLVEAAAA
jgi:hypothetical protein